MSAKLDINMHVGRLAFEPGGAPVTVFCAIGRVLEAQYGARCVGQESLNRLIRRIAELAIAYQAMPLASVVKSKIKNRKS